MFKVKLTFPYPYWDLKRQTPGSKAIWGDYQFFINEEIPDCDYWVVFNHLSRPEESTTCPPKNTLLFTGEPYALQRYNKSFLNQFEKVVTCQREIRHRDVNYFHQGHPWFVGASYNNGHYTSFGKSYDELMATNYVPKSKTLSIVTSNKLFTDGHKRRYDFALRLKDKLGDAIDLYGRGVRDFSDKWDVLADYKYTVAIENLVYPDWMTEKLYDCFMALSFPFYYGLPNVEDYFDRRAFERIDINDFDASLRTIEKVLGDQGHYERSLDALIEAKKKYLDHYNLFPLMARYLSELKTGGEEPRRVVLLNNHKPVPSIVERIKRRLIKIVK